jgi:uncharacterized protein (DUF305 family)
MTTTRRTPATLGAATLAATLAVTLAVTLAACGSDDGGDHGGHDPSAVETARNGDEFNHADVAFATAMIPHHAQAVQMANLAADRPLPAALRTLVDGVHTAQVGEVETMVTWLTDWGQEIPETSMDHVNAGHDMASMGDPDEGGMPGMMSAEEMVELEAATDAEFPDLWMTMMVEHHEGAIAMAETEQEDGHFPAALDLADAVIEAQQAEIAAMESLLRD